MSSHIDPVVTLISSLYIVCEAKIIEIIHSIYHIVTL